MSCLDSFNFNSSFTSQLFSTLMQCPLAINLLVEHSKSFIIPNFYTSPPTFPENNKRSNQNGPLKTQHLPPPFHLLRTRPPPQPLGHQARRHRPRLLPPLRLVPPLPTTRAQPRRRMRNKRRPLLPRMRHQRPPRAAQRHQTGGAGAGRCEEAVSGR